MTFVVELRDLKKNLPRPVTHFWQRAVGMLCGLRVSLALLGLLCVSFDWPVDGGDVPNGDVLALLCGVLTAAVSATLGLVSDAGSGLSALFYDDASAVSPLGQRLRLCFGKPLFPFDGCPAAGDFPTLSGHGTLALIACALLLFGCGFSRNGPACQDKTR